MRKPESENERRKRRRMRLIHVMFIYAVISIGLAWFF